MNVCLHYVKAALNDFLDLLERVAQAESSSDALSFFKVRCMNMLTNTQEKHMQ